ncbi:CSP41A [Auxenochlorella protothecoides x Auxenochlorella symbiontica]
MLGGMTSNRTLSGQPLHAPTRTRRAALARRAAPRAEHVLISNTKSGGHAFLGLHLAQRLLEQGHEVTILNAGSKEKLEKNGPFAEYANVKGLEVVWGDATDSSFLESLKPYDVVVENNGKDLDTCKPLIDAFKGRKGTQYIFIASAGAYKPDPNQPPLVEGDPRKESAGHVAVEKYIEQEHLPYTVFQPLYIYGPHTAKDCEQWFLDRILRDEPVPVPGNGLGLVTLSHVADVAAMVAAAVPGKPAALGQHFNVCSDRAVTHAGIVHILAEAAGREARLAPFDAEETGKLKATGFPFRPGHFFASSDKAKRELGWKPEHTFTQDAAELVEAYKASGRLDQEMDFSGGSV